MLISSDDIVRLIETLDTNLRLIREYITKFEDRQIFMNRSSDNDVDMSDISILGTCLEMPSSSAQREGLSRRQEGLEYLKRLCGNLS